MILLSAVGCGVAPVEGWFVDLHGRVVDERSVGVEGATVRFATPTGVDLGATESETDGSWHMPVYGTELVGNSLILLIESADTADLRAVLDVNLRSPEVVALDAGPAQTWQTTERRVPTLRLADPADAASVEGQVLDALTGRPVGGLPVSLQRGWNAPLGDPSEGEATTDAEGRFAFTTWPAGWYTVSVAPTEVYDPARFPAFLTAGGGQARGTVSPHVAVGQLRASLVWGSAPADLDLHLSAPLQGGQAGEDGNGQYHVYVGEPHHPDEDPEANGWEAAVELSTNAGTGPETVAIYEAPGPGEIRLSVVDMDHLADPSSTALSESGAVLQVWNGDDLSRYYTVSPAEIATWWRPFAIDAGSGVVFQAEEYAVNVNPADADAF